MVKQSKHCLISLKFPNKELDFSPPEPLDLYGAPKAHMAKNNDVEIPAHGFLNYVQGLQNKRAHR